MKLTSNQIKSYSIFPSRNKEDASSSCSLVNLCKMLAKFLSLFISISKLFSCPVWSNKCSTQGQESFLFFLFNRTRLQLHRLTRFCQMEVEWPQSNVDHSLSINETKKSIILQSYKTCYNEFNIFNTCCNGNSQHIAFLPSLPMWMDDRFLLISICLYSGGPLLLELLCSSVSYSTDLKFFKKLFLEFSTERCWFKFLQPNLFFCRLWGRSGITNSSPHQVRCVKKMLYQRDFSL